MTAKKTSSEARYPHTIGVRLIDTAQSVDRVRPAARLIEKFFLPLNTCAM
jgi:hypothetical protein